MKEEEERKGEASPGLALGTGVGGWRQRAGGRTRFSEVGGSSRGGMSALLLLLLPPLLEEVVISLLSSSGLESWKRFISQIKVYVTYILCIF